MDLIEKKMKSGKVLGFVMLDTKMEMKAAKIAGDVTKYAGQLTMMNETIKLTLREIDGNPVTYQDLSNLDEYFNYPELTEVRALYAEVHSEKKDPLE